MDIQFLIKRIQASLNLEVDGIAGPATWKAIVDELAPLPKESPSISVAKTGSLAKKLVELAKEEIGEFDSKLAVNMTLEQIRSQKPKRIESHKVVIDAGTRDKIEMINKQKILVINSEEKAFFLAKPVGKIRKAEIKDVKQSKGVIQRGMLLQVVKYFNKTIS